MPPWRKKIKSNPGENKDPVNRWKILFAILFAFTVGIIGIVKAVDATNSPSFCSSCHEMRPEYETFKASAHNQATCVQCHIKPGTLNMLVHKVKSVKEVYYHFAGVPEQIVQTAGEAIPNENCLQCHSKDREVTATKDLKSNHEGHIKKNIPCITCHAGVAHSKIAARGLNTEKARDYWTDKNAEKLMGKEYMFPNMGTCMDCHARVNNGEKPWKDIAYSVPQQGKHPGENNPIEKEEGTKQAILQVFGKEDNEQTISMECSTCHQQIEVPQSHRGAGWNYQHGKQAIKEIDVCIGCHENAQWTKAVEKQDILSLLNKDAGKDGVSIDLAIVREKARSNQFCSGCHGKRPPGHLVIGQWLRGHANFARSDEEKEHCFFCHDKKEQLPGSGKAMAPTNLYCEYCHNRGFLGEL